MNELNNTNLRIKAVKDKVTTDKLLKQRNKDYTDLEDKLNVALTTISEQSKIITDLKSRYNKECYNVVVDNDYVTKLIELPAYRSYLPLQEISGIDMNKVKQFMSTPLYAKIPFIKLNGRVLKLDVKQYKKFIGGVL